MDFLVRQWRLLVVEITLLEHKRAHIATETKWIISLSVDYSRSAIDKTPTEFLLYSPHCFVASAMLSITDHNAFRNATNTRIKTRSTLNATQVDRKHHF